MLHDSDDYHKNLQLLADTLSSRTRSPCIAYSTGQDTFIAQPDGYEQLPETLNLIRASIKIEMEPETKELKFDSLTPLAAKLALRFLQGSIQRDFYNSHLLWQPRAGAPFFQKTPDQRFRELSDDVDLFRGFAFRVVLLSSGRIGVCVDVTSKYVSRFPLPTKISRDDSRKYQGMKCLYEYGNRWYEIRIESLADLDASEIKLPPDNISLFEDIHLKAGSYKSQNLRSLPKDCSVLIYYNTFKEPRHAPSGLCRLTYGTDHPHIQRYHSQTIKAPFLRRNEIKFAVDGYFRNLAFGSEKIVLSEKPMTVEDNSFIIPDLQFGKNKILSVRDAPNSVRTSLWEFKHKKKELLYSPEAGLFTKKPFDRQYLVLPKSVNESFGEKFIRDIKTEVKALFLDDKIPYEPTVIHYDDSVQKSVYAIGREIIKAVEENAVNPGFGLVMIPEMKSRRKKRDDELANLIMRELRKRDIFVSVIHTTAPSESYEYVSTDGNNGEWRLVGDSKRQSKYKGYVRNVVLNKILILNSFWPFVLKTPLNADLIIGIDVKNNTAGFTLVNKNSAEITFNSSESEQKEQLNKNHVRTKIFELIQNEQRISNKTVKTIVIHRQGRLFPQEREGVLQAVKMLADQKAIDSDCKCTFVEIRTTSRIPLRLFKVKPLPDAQKEWVENPMIGTYVQDIFKDDAFICTTGPPYEHKGTTVPLHIIKDGPLSINSILQDVFYLSNLTWTKIDDCSRHPLSVKMTDIRLREFAGEYDAGSLKFGEEE